MALRAMTRHSVNPVYALFKIVFCNYTYIQITPRETKDWSGIWLPIRMPIGVQKLFWKASPMVPISLGETERKTTLEPGTTVRGSLSSDTLRGPCVGIYAIYLWYVWGNVFLTWFGTPKSSPHLLYVVLQSCLSKNWSWCCQRLEPRWKNTPGCCPLDRSMVGVSCSSVPNHLQGG